MEVNDVLSILSEHYGINGNVSALPGEVDLNYRIACSEGSQFVFKVAGPERTIEEIDFQLAFLKHLSKSSFTFEIPEVVPARGGNAVIEHELGTSRHIIHMLSWVHGRPLRKLKHRSKELLQSWGAVCGQLSKALEGFDHPQAHRYYKWDPQHCLDARGNLNHVLAKADVTLATYFFNLFEVEAKPQLATLRHSVNYNDAHEDNLLINTNVLSPSIVGLVDVGDAIHTQTINELAIACAYAGMDSVDPIASMAEVVAGYHEEFPLEEEELQVLFPLIAGRLLITVTSAAQARANDPDNAYRSVSEDQAWAVLRKLKNVHPRLAHCQFRAACGLEPCAKADSFRKWIASHPAFSAIVNVAHKRLAPLDLSVGSHTLGNYNAYQELSTFSKRIEDMLEAADAEIGYGGYLETRPVYTTELFEEQGNDGPRWRTVHLGLDIWSPAGTEVRSPYAGRVHSFRQNNNPRDYGATIILEHSYEVEGEVKSFYTLYGHLSAASLEGLSAGQKVEAGEVIATYGTPNENGGWPPHLHFQVILDLLGKEGDFAGVAFPEEAEVYASICPNAAELSGIDNLQPTLQHRSSTSILEARKKHLGRSLSLSYKQSLHMVRGQGAYLLDATGRRYLDTVNNVAHVGHEHPKVVAAIQQQAALLNTNTRYLHEEIVAFAEELCASLPPELSVVHVVNSGSEANELALRMARAAMGQKDMIAVEVGYHGNTNAVIDVSSYKFDGKGGEGAPPTTHIVPIPDTYRGLHRDPKTAGEDYANYLDKPIAEVKRQGRGIAGFICESILSCGGQVVLPKGYLKSAFAKTRAAGGICISDEVQVGVGRVGEHFWGFELQGVVPDVVVIGKPIGNGHPLGVVVCTEAVADAFAATGMEYFNTFGGNPVSCAAGRAVLRVVREEGLQQNAKLIGNYLLAQLRELQSRHSVIGDVRGHGLFLGVELVRDRTTLEPADSETTYIANRMRERGVLMSTDGPYHNILKIKPPMCFGMREAEFLIGAFDRVLSELAT